MNLDWQVRLQQLQQQFDLHNLGARLNQLRMGRTTEASQPPAPSGLSPADTRRVEEAVMDIYDDEDAKRAAKRKRQQ